MKKFLSALLICAMLVSFTACSKDDSNNKTNDDDDDKITTTATDTNKDVGSDEDNTETGVITDAATDAATDAVTDAVTDGGETTAPDTEASDPNEDALSVLADYKRGVYENNKYESKFLGIGLNLDESLTVATDEELKQLIELTSGITGVDYEQLVKDGKATYDFYAANADNSTNVIITLEKMTPAKVKLLNLELVYTQSANVLDQTYASMGFTEFDRKIKTVKISGVDHMVMDYVASANGASMYQSVLLIKGGDYLATVCLTTVDKALAESSYSNVYLVK